MGLIGRIHLHGTEQRTVFILRCGDMTALCKRPEKGLLAGLWELPNVAGHLAPEAAIAQAEVWGTAPYEIEREVHRSHIFTHIEWEMRGYHLRCRELSPQFRWASPEELRTELALPTAFRMFLDED